MSFLSGLARYVKLLTGFLERLVLVTQNSKLHPNVSALSSLNILLHEKNKDGEGNSHLQAQQQSGNQP